MSNNIQMREKKSKSLRKTLLKFLYKSKNLERKKKKKGKIKLPKKIGSNKIRLKKTP